MAHPFLAQMAPNDEWMVLILGAIMLIIPIVAILTRHQQTMAKILREQSGAGSQAELEALRGEVARLTQAVHQQTIQLDNLSRQSLNAPEPRLASEPPCQPLQTR